MKQISIFGDDVPFEAVQKKEPATKSTKTKKVGSQTKNKVTTTRSKEKPYSTPKDTEITLPVTVLIDNGTHIHITPEDFPDLAPVTADNIRNFLCTVGKPFKYRLLKSEKTLFDYHREENILQLTLKSAPKGNIALFNKLENGFYLVNAKNGLFIVLIKEFSITIVSATSSEDLLKLPRFDVKHNLSPGVVLKELIDFRIIKPAINFFKHYAKRGLEAGAVVLFDTNTKEYLLHVPYQDISATDLQLYYDDLPSNYMKVLEMHSHHNYNAVFSKKDDMNECHECIFIVFGNYKHNQFEKMSARYFINNKYHPLKLDGIFTTFSLGIPDMPTYSKWHNRVSIMEV